jgi:hypothetical protein
MHRQLRRRFWLETGMALISSAVLLLTIFWHDWIEIVFKFDPDQYSGSLEWLIVAILLAVTVALAAVARREWRHCPAVSP